MTHVKGQSRLSDAMAAEEGARARIAADIHDDTIQGARRGGAASSERA